MENLKHIVFITKEDGQILFDFKLEEETIPNLRELRQSFINMSNMFGNTTQNNIKIKEEEKKEKEDNELKTVLIESDEEEENKNIFDEERIVLFFLNN